MRANFKPARLSVHTAAGNFKKRAILVLLVNLHASVSQLIRSSFHMDLFVGEEGQMYQDTVGVYTAHVIPNYFSTICHAIVCVLL
jgi:hypothetical protein